VLADPTELHSVIMNLCTNAWHALRGRSGLITVGLEEVEPDQDFIRQHPDLRSGRYVRLTVADDGCGMDEATLGRIFEPFFTTKAVGEGTGLGLAVVHGIVRSYDGCIVVQSQPGVGTSFQLYFPVFAAEAPAAAPPPPTAPRGGGEHILFVDDEEPLARLGTRMLERLGYRVTPHTDPAEALAVFRARPTDFDLVVVDYNMPGLNGTEFGAQVLEVRPVQRIILATGYSANLTPEAARDLGFRELMPKPYDLNRLGETVHRALHGDDLRP
jgi:CheY-like chemotaxis protein